MTSFLTAATQTRFITHTIYNSNSYGKCLLWRCFWYFECRASSGRCEVLCVKWWRSVSLQSVADREVFLPTTRSGCTTYRVDCVMWVCEWGMSEWVSEWVMSEWVSEWVSECNVLWSPELNQLTLSTSVHLWFCACEGWSVFERVVEISFMNPLKAQQTWTRTCWTSSVWGSWST